MQRYGDRYLLWYSLMFISSLAMVLLVYVMYALGRDKAEAAEEIKEPTEKPVTENTVPETAETVTVEATTDTEEEEENPAAVPAGLAAVSAVLAALGFSALLFSGKKKD